MYMYYREITKKVSDTFIDTHACAICTDFMYISYYTWYTALQVNLQCCMVILTLRLA